MPKLLRGAEEYGALMLHCPGCGHSHQYYTKKVGAAPCWTFNGDMERPTFSPSLLVQWPKGERRCHLYVREGRIEFLGDCFHYLAGQTVDMEDVDA